MITLRLPRDLAELMGGVDAVQRLPAAGTLGELLRLLDARVPGILSRICEPGGRIRSHLNVFVGEENARLKGGLATRLADGAEVWVIQAVSGG